MPFFSPSLPPSLSSSPPFLLPFLSTCSHFHLDHCGALPYFTEMCGYDGPIYMTHPTKAICPILLVGTTGLNIHFNLKVLFYK